MNDSLSAVLAAKQILDGVALKTPFELLENFSSDFDGKVYAKRMGDLTYSICKENLDDIILVPEGDESNDRKRFLHSVC